ncbi:hypothetical protein J3459_016091 [Metarhizium acridum]|nr:hypothetical protein J3459_016091 [Metarhizium acridum]
MTPEEWFILFGAYESKLLTRKTAFVYLFLKNYFIIAIYRCTAPEKMQNDLCVHDFCSNRALCCSVEPSRPVEFWQPQNSSRMDQCHADPEIENNQSFMDVKKAQTSMLL